MFKLDFIGTGKAGDNDLDNVVAQEEDDRGVGHSLRGGSHTKLLKRFRNNLLLILLKIHYVSLTFPQHVINGTFSLCLFRI